MSDIYSFYQLISKYQIEIPIIQRDYAQGRDNAKAVDVRKSLVKKMINAIENEKIGHAYLFNGTRGTGKTTMAKILAKMVNCEHPVDGNACNECDSCLNILKSNDVIEIDAASNNGVDEIRNLREKANLVPTSSKFVSGNTSEDVACTDEKAYIITSENFILFLIIIIISPSNKTKISFIISFFS